jgi:hypothetical protein
MAKRKKVTRKAEMPLDTFPRKRPRGRPRKVIPTEIRGRADNYRGMLNQVWDRLWPLLSQSQTEEDVIRAFDQGASPYTREFVPSLASLVLKIVRERKFRKRRTSRIGFLGDSLAGLGRVSPRRARDICANERARMRGQSQYKILRKDFYVECSCGYKGPALDNACRECGAGIPLSLDMLWGS